MESFKILDFLLWCGMLAVFRCLSHASSSATIDPSQTERIFGWPWNPSTQSCSPVTSTVHVPVVIVPTSSGGYGSGQTTTVTRTVALSVSYMTLTVPSYITHQHTQCPWSSQAVTSYITHSPTPCPSYGQFVTTTKTEALSFLYVTLTQPSYITIQPTSCLGQQQTSYVYQTSYLYQTITQTIGGGGVGSVSTEYYPVIITKSRRCRKTVTVTELSQCLSTAVVDPYQILPSEYLRFGGSTSTVYPS